jgi:hypothetical protein
VSTVRPALPSTAETRVTTSSMGKGNQQIDLVDVRRHQHGHHADQVTTAPSHRAKSGKLLGQDLVLALIREHSSTAGSPRTVRIVAVGGVCHDPAS